MTVGWHPDLRTFSGGTFSNFREDFRRLQDHGIRLIPIKCIFIQPGPEFLGHWMDQLGIRPLAHKMEAIMEANSPTNVIELNPQSFPPFCTLCMTFCKTTGLGSGLRIVTVLLWRVSVSFKIHLCWFIMTLRNHFAWPVPHHPMVQGRWSLMWWRMVQKSVLPLPLRHSLSVRVVI